MLNCHLYGFKYCFTLPTSIIPNCQELIPVEPTSTYSPLGRIFYQKIHRRDNAETYYDRSLNNPCRRFGRRLVSLVRERKRSNKSRGAIFSFFFFTLSFRVVFEFRDVFIFFQNL